MSPDRHGSPAAPVASLSPASPAAPLRRARRAGEPKAPPARVATPLPLVTRMLLILASLLFGILLADRSAGVAEAMTIGDAMVRPGGLAPMTGVAGRPTAPRGGRVISAESLVTGFTRRAAAERRAADVRALRVVLARHSSDSQVTTQVARAIVREARRFDLPVSLITGIVLVENPDLKPTAESFAGAQGIMQVMPMHAGRMKCGTADLTDVAGNVCHGTTLFAWLVRSNAGNIHTALLRYNGCVRGTNTPNCHQYPTWVLRRAAETRRALAAVRHHPIETVARWAEPEPPSLALEATTDEAN